MHCKNFIYTLFSIGLITLTTPLYAKSENASSTFLASGYQTKENTSPHPILFSSSDAGKSWQKIEIANVDSNYVGRVEDISCRETLCTALGYTDDNQSELLLTGSENGQKWLNQTSEAIPYRNIHFTSTNCKDDFCVVGGYTTDANYINKPLILLGHTDINNPQLQTWENIKLAYNADENILVDQVKCMDNDTCIARGENRSTSANLNIVVLTSHDKGTSWTYSKNISSLPSSKIFLQDIDCSSNMCILPGWWGDTTSKGWPLLLTSYDKGESWSAVADIQDPALFNSAYLYKASCTDNVCMTVGLINNADGSREPLIFRSADAGKSWTQIKNFPTKLKNGYLFNIKCQGETCVATGEWKMGNHALLILVSHDAGQSWMMPENLSLPKNVKHIFQTDIDYANNTWVITEEVRVIQSDGSTPPKALWLVSEDDGKTWSYTQQGGGVTN